MTICSIVVVDCAAPETQELFTDPASTLHLQHISHIWGWRKSKCGSDLVRYRKQSHSGVGKSKNTAPKSTLTQIRIYSIFFKKNACRTHFTKYTKELCIYLWERWRIFHLLWLCLKQQEEREVILFGLHHISLKIASLQQVCEWILTVFDQCNACQNSGGLTGKCVRFWCHSVSEVYLTGGGMGKGEKWISNYLANIIAMLHHTCLTKPRWVCWLVSSRRAGLPTQ